MQPTTPTPIATIGDKPVLYRWAPPYDDPIHEIEMKSSFWLWAFLYRSWFYRGGAYIVDFSRLAPGSQSWLKKEVPGAMFIAGIGGLEIWFPKESDVIAFKLACM